MTDGKLRVQLGGKVGPPGHEGPYADAHKSPYLHRGSLPVTFNGTTRLRPAGPGRVLHCTEAPIMTPNPPPFPDRFATPAAPQPALPPEDLRKLARGCLLRALVDDGWYTFRSLVQLVGPFL